MSTQVVKRALLSVFDKQGITELATALHQRGVSLLSTGGTARLLKEHGIPVTDVSDHTGFPEIMGGRVKTLHPRVHGGLLGRRGTDDEVMQEHGIEAIDLLVVNLYPFAETIAREGVSRADCIEMIDIGGPAMLRAAAKNHQHVAVLTDPADYDQVLSELDAGGTQRATRQRLAAKAFAMTAEYDRLVSDYLTGESSAAPSDGLPAAINLQLHQQATLRYGENPHQRAAFYRAGQAPAGTVGAAIQHQGKPLSYNNIADADAALDCVLDFQQPACVIVKHANPCGVAVAADIGTAYDAAFAGDPESAFGGIIAFNQSLDAQTAATIIDRQFAEVIVAPSVSGDALEVLSAKKNLRVLSCGERAAPSTQLRLQSVHGGLLVQDFDHADLSDASLEVVSDRQPSEAEWADLKFAWQVVKHVKSNAIVYARDGRSLGIGPGQTSRVMSARIAVLKAQAAEFDLAGSALASDAFFPFRDGIDAAAKAGARAVIQPGGSMRDNEVIEAANEHGMTMVFTGIRHFRH